VRVRRTSAGRCRLGTKLGPCLWPSWPPGRMSGSGKRSSRRCRSPRRKRRDVIRSKPARGARRTPCLPPARLTIPRRPGGSEHDDLHAKTFEVPGEQPGKGRMSMLSVGVQKCQHLIHLRFAPPHAGRPTLRRPVGYSNGSERLLCRAVGRSARMSPAGP